MLLKSNTKLSYRFALSSNYGTQMFNRFAGLADYHDALLGHVCDAFDILR